MFSEGHVRAKDCVFVSGQRTRGFTLLAHASMHFHGCTIANYGRDGASTIHFEEEPEEPKVSFSHCDFLTDAVHLDMGCYFVHDEPEGEEARARAAELRRAFERDNDIRPAHNFYYGHGDFDY